MKMQEMAAFHVFSLANKYLGAPYVASRSGVKGMVAYWKLTTETKTLRFNLSASETFWELGYERILPDHVVDIVALEIRSGDILKGVTDAR